MTNICKHFVTTSVEHRNSIATEFKDKVWQKETWFSYANKVAQLSHYFDNLNIEKESKIAILAESSYEWAIVDYSILFSQNISVPIYTNNTIEDTAYILKHCEAKVLVVDSKESYSKWKAIKEEYNYDIKVISTRKLENNILSLNKIFSEQKVKTTEIFSFLEDKASAINNNALATIVYTSGTTGTPKGVMLGHQQILSEVNDLRNLVHLDENDKSMIFLPLAHILARLEIWMQVISGHCVSYAESIERLRSNFLKLKPTFVVSVPRIYEKMYNGVLSQAQASPLRMSLFEWAKKIGNDCANCRKKNKNIPIKLQVEYKVAKKLVFNRLKEKLGGRLRFAISGGAPLNKEILNFFYTADLLILEGYGLTETSGGITFNTPKDFKFATVGKPFGDVKLKFSEENEILVKSKKVMLGYLKNVQKEEDAFTSDGWLKTGDIGYLDNDGFLTISDRKKDLIKTSGGKFIAPQKIENKLKESPYVSNALIHGDQKKYIVSLITLNKEELTSYLKENNVSYTDKKHLANHPEVRKLIREAVSEANQQLASYETVKYFEILDNDFSIETGELTPSLKVKRKFCDSKYKDIIDSLYRS